LLSLVLTVSPPGSVMLPAVRWCVRICLTAFTQAASTVVVFRRGRLASPPTVNWLYRTAWAALPLSGFVMKGL
jgi:hypothetical protein